MGNRIIKESCRTSDQLNQLSDGAERMFWRLITVADDFGRFEADPVTLKAHCFPKLVDTLKTAKIKGWIDEFISVGLVKLYQSNDKTYGFFPTWDKHQRRRAQFSKHPAPTSDNICRQMLRNAPEDTRNRGYEESRHEDTLTGGFEDFWKAYPKKADKQKALEVWNKISPNDALRQTILAAIERQKASEQWQKDKGQYIPLPTTWLNRKRWEDEITPFSSPQADSGYQKSIELIQKERDYQNESIRTT